MAKVTGRVFIKVNGMLLRSKDGAKLTGIGGVERSEVVGPAGVYGYVEKVVAPSIECTLADTADLKLADIAAMTDVTCTFETDTGKTYIVRNAWSASPPSIAGGEGDVECKFTGVAVEAME